MHLCYAADAAIRNTAVPRRLHHNMRPLQFTCTTVLQNTPQAIAEQILNLDNWTKFHGYGLLPGIRSATFAKRTPQIVGTCIAVVNTDGSEHVEEVVEWNPSARLTLKMHRFTPPLARLATHIDETWTFEPAAEGTLVRRSFAMHPSWWFGNVMLRLIAPMLRRAVERHLESMAADEQAGVPQS